MFRGFHRVVGERLGRCGGFEVPAAFEVFISNGGEFVGYAVAISVRGVLEVSGFQTPAHTPGTQCQTYELKSHLIVFVEV